MTTFKDIGIDEKLISAIEDLGFEKPMPIQEIVIPALIKEDCGDIVGLAQTGTGKTAAFGVPLLQRTDIKNKKPQFLILSPTRELCLQIADDLISFAKYIPGVRISAVFGGTSIDKQIKDLKKGAHIISATPGRLLDLIHRGKVDISNVRTVVLDEADEMLNMGFRDDLEEILKETPDEKNTLLFSATMPKEVAQISKRYMNNPTEFSVGKKNAGAENVKHEVYMVNAKQRYLALKRIVDYYPNIYGIVFCRTRKETQEIADKLIADGYNADCLHGDLSQNQRDMVMNKFRIRHLKLLVATDVAARGLDVDDLTHVINYNLPEENEIYTHRSGRTGRAGKAGISIAIANLKENRKIATIEKQLNKKFEYKDIPEGRDICEKQLFHVIDRMEKVEVEYSQIEEYLPNIYKKLEWLDREELIKKFVSVEFNRFLEYYKNAPKISKVSAKNDSSKRESTATGFTRFFINLGKRDGFKPTTLIGMVNDFTGNRDIDIGEIDIAMNFSFFETDSDFAEDILEGFEGQEHKKRLINVEIAAKKKSSGGGFRGKRDGSRGGGNKRGRDRNRDGEKSFRGSKGKRDSKRKR